MTTFCRTLRVMSMQSTRIACALMLATTAASAQPGASWQRADRAVLTKAVDSLDRVLANPKLAKKDREATQGQLESLKARLTTGDFQVGDRFLYTIVADTIRSDSATIRDGYLVSIGVIPDFSLRGVLRSELPARLNSEIARYVKNAIVRAFPLTRVNVLGSVGREGYYYHAPDRPLSEVFMAAGGVRGSSNSDGTTSATPAQVEIRRGGRVLITRLASEQALREGKTLEQLDIQSGDEIRVYSNKRARRISWSAVLQILFVASSLLLAFVRFLEWYYREQ